MIVEPPVGIDAPVIEKRLVPSHRKRRGEPQLQQQGDGKNPVKEGSRISGPRISRDRIQRIQFHTTSLHLNF